MSWMLVLAMLAAPPLESQPAPAAAVVESVESVPALSAEMQTGTLLVSAGECLAVKTYTRSPYTHVAVVVRRHEQPYVYDSMNGRGVRCLTLASYLEDQTPAELHVFQPRVPFTPAQTARLEKYLDSQLGRPYGVRHHLTGGTSKGIHCSEYATCALIETGLLRASEPARVSPASLIDGALTTKTYVSAGTLRLQVAPEPVAQPGRSWCSRMWTDTKQCTKGCYQQMRRWFCCS